MKIYLNTSKIQDIAYFGENKHQNIDFFQYLVLQFKK